MGGRSTNPRRISGNDMIRNWVNWVESYRCILLRDPIFIIPRVDLILGSRLSIQSCAIPSWHMIGALVIGRTGVELVDSSWIGDSDPPFVREYH